MTTKNIVLQNENKLRRENLVQFISAANSFSGSIAIENHLHRVNAKSLLGLLALEIKKGTELILSADSDNSVEEDRAINDLIAYLV